ncbi:ATP-binding cassette domain-containing protein [Curtobacterium ammoniigenes]|uniref:ATP-binding cassette domain-containing protein n=1 Tax=Curtobacterium ammoniigenes TaxID=395387 RepID=UPI0008349734|nr:ATP-binding cassette domain-containing protein [Curtobacterium ammoniigenes]
MRTIALTAAGVRIDLVLHGVTIEGERELRRAWAGCITTGPQPPAMRIRCLLVESESASLAPLRAAAMRMGSEVGPGQPDVVAQSFSELSAAIVARVTAAVIERRSDDATLLHAAGLARRGSVIGFVGPSGAGKSTLIREIADEYVSDETLVVDASGVVSPYPKPISIVADGAPKTQHAPADFGLHPVTERLPLGALVLLDRSPGTREARIRRVSLAASIPDLVPQVSHLARRRDGLSRLSVLVACAGPLLRLTYGESSQVRAILDMLVDDRRAPANRSPGTPGRRYRRAVIDWVQDAEHVIVLRQSTVNVLSPSASLVWLALDYPQPASRIAQRVGLEASQADRILSELLEAELVER